MTFLDIRLSMSFMPLFMLPMCRSVEMESGTHPCWMAGTCCDPKDCYHCQVYRAAAQCGNLKAMLANSAQ